MTNKIWQDIARTKKQTLYDSIPQKWQHSSLKEDMLEAGFSNAHDYLDTILPVHEVEVTQMSVAMLQTKIASRELSALEVTEAFCHRAALAQQILNFCSEIFLEEAMERARFLDTYLEKNGKTIGPLHGIPVSLKDQVDLPGKDSAIGYVYLTNKPKTKMSLLAEILKDQGAVFYVKTTVPMAMMAPETVSNINGYTYNSLNIELSAGGSSGGEGSILGAGASCIGFGTDIGGSIRIPSCFQGLYALKPSTGRIPYMDVTNSVSGQECVPSVIGPMARNLEDIERITKMVVDSEPWKYDPKVLAVPWKDMSHLKTSKLVFGIWKFDKSVLPHPPIIRALDEVATLLRLNGHDVIEIDIPMSGKILDTVKKVYSADAGTEIQSECDKSGEPVVSVVKSCVSDDIYESSIDVNTWWDLCNEVYAIKQEFLSFWNATSEQTVSGRPIDCIVCPIWPSTSCLPYSPVVLNYTAPFNVTDCASVVLPVSKVDSKIDLLDVNYVPANSLDEEIQKSYNAKLFHNMPVCVQVVTKKLEEEKALAIADTIKLLLEKLSK